jgi:NAD(P)H-dependent FMN reductase
MKQILDKMVQSDVIVLATPTYFYTMDGQMKTFLDRTVPVYQAISGKEFYFIVTAWDPECTHLQRIVEEFRGYTDCLNDPIEKGILLAAGVTDKTDVERTKYLAQAYQFGKGV